MLLVWIACLGFPAVTAQAEETDKKYGEYTLAQWQLIIKSTDFRTLGKPENVDGLIEIIRDEDLHWTRRRQAGETLGRIGQEAAAAVPILQQFLNKPGDDVLNTRAWVLKSLSLFGTVAAAASEDVRDLVLDPTQPHLVRINGMEALGRIGKDGNIALPTFVTILRDQSTDAGSQKNEVRLAAAEALWILGPAAAPALPALIDVAREDWPLIRLAAITSIGQVGSRAEIAIPLLVDTVLFDEAGEVREVAADALGKIGQPAYPAFEQLLSDEDVEVRKLLIRALKQARATKEVRSFLITALNDDAHLIRFAAADALLLLDTDLEIAQEKLLQLIDDSDRRVRLEASRACYRHAGNSRSFQVKLQRIVQSETATNTARDLATKVLKKVKFDAKPL